MTIAAIRADKSLWMWGANASGQLGDGTANNRGLPTRVAGSWTAVATRATGAITVALRTDGTLWTWGSNSNGSVGDNTAVSRSSPVQVGLIPSPIRSKMDPMALIHTDGSLWTWGYNNKGQLGNGSTINQSSPVRVGTSSWTTISVDELSSTGAIRIDGALFTWGSNAQGQLGDGTTIDKSSPVQIGTSSWTAVSVNGSYMAAIRSDGALFAWGWNNFGQLGDSTIVNKSSPVQIGTSSWTAVSAGISFTVAIRSDGTLWAWGLGTGGQLGDGTVINKSSPVQVSTSSWVAVSAGTQSVQALRSDNTLWSWGVNSLGQLGDGTTINKSSPVQIGTSSWTAITLGQGYSAAIRSDGTLWAWGTNTQGALGDGTTVNKSSPVQIGTLSNWTAVAAKYSTTAAVGPINPLQVGGVMQGWGYNVYSQTGDITVTNRSSPVQVGITFPPSFSWSFVSAGRENVAAIDQYSRLWMWGYGIVGQLGNGSTINKSTPTIFDANSWVAVDIHSTGHTLGKRADGTIWAWGGNGAGQLGDGTTISKSSPVQIGTSSWVKVVVGEFHTLALRADGTLWSWGSNANGQLGDGTTINKSSPVLVVSPRGWKDVAAGLSFTMALDTSNVLWGWGLNSTGQLGDGTTLSRSSPALAGTGFPNPRFGSGVSYTAVRATGSTTMALRSDGTLWMWGGGGSNVLGQGHNVSANQSSPVQVGFTSSPTFTSIKTGDSYSVALDSVGNIWTWGFGYGIGNGADTQRIGPRAVTRYNERGTPHASWKYISAGSGSTSAIRSDGTLWGWGQGTNGQLGSGGNTTTSSPVQAGLLPLTVAQTNTSNISFVGITSFPRLNYNAVNSMILTTFGSLIAWGSNVNGSLGDNTSLSNKSLPVFAPTMSDTRWNVISTGANFTHGIKSDSSLWAWGYNAFNQLGDGTTIDKSSPVQVVAALRAASPATRALSNALGFIDEYDSVWLWGDNTYGNVVGQVGITTVSSPVMLPYASTSNLSWSSMAGGIYSGAAIRSDGALFMWGNNTYGQLGDGTTVNKPSFPVQIGTSSWAMVSVNHSLTMAIKSDGTLWSWGQNGVGGLGDGTTVDKSSPVQVSTSSWTMVSSGLSRAAAIRTDGALFVWGIAKQGQLGDGTTTVKSSPVQIGTSSWTAVDASIDVTTYAIRADGALFAWGQNTLGQLGDGTTVDKSSPVQIGTSSWTAVSGGLAIRADGTLWAWGSGTNGALGDGTTISKSSPVQIGYQSWLAVNSTGSGSQKARAVRSDGALFVWGSGVNGSLGDGTTISKSSPVFTIATNYPKVSWTFVTTGVSNAFAVDSTGMMWSWGGNTPFGVLGNGSTVSRNLPATNGYGPASWTLISTGSACMHALQQNGTLWAWGRNNTGQIGDGTTIDKSSPVRVGTNSWTIVASGAGCGITTDGKLWTWGGGSNGLGDGTTTNRSSPVQVRVAASWLNMSTSSTHTLAIKSDGTLWGWGTGVGGGLGDGTTTDKSSPIQIGTSSWTTVTAAGSSAAAIRSDGALFVWGLNNYGGIGDGTTINKSSPVQIGTSSWIAVSLTTSGALTLAIRLDGALFAWGYGGNGFGDGTTTNRSSPVQVGTSSWTAVAIGELTSTNGTVIALRKDGALFTWGSNNLGQLGDNTTVGKSIATQIGTSSWTAISTNSTGNLTSAVRLDGALFTWGYGVSGGLGDGTTINKSSPVQIGTSSWTAVRLGSSGGFAIKSGGTLWGWGTSGNGALGDGTVVDKSSPVQIGIYSWKTISAGSSQTGAIRFHDNTIWMWGYGNTGGLGDGTTVTKSRPTIITTNDLPTYGWTDVVNITTPIAIDQYSRMWAWGTNVNGTLGDGTTIDKSFAVQIQAGSWAAVGGGQGYVLAKKTDGTIWAWGFGTGGQLGDNTIVSKSSPVVISVPLSFNNVAVGGLHAAAVSNKTLFTWGLNSTGQLGDNTFVSKSTPQWIGLLNNPTLTNDTTVARV